VSQTLHAAFRNYRKQSFKNAWAKAHPDKTIPVVQDGSSSTAATSSSSTAAASSSTAAIPILDKLCSGVTDRELFKKEYEAPINQRKETLRSERLEHGGTLNPAAIYQRAQKDVWEALPADAKEDLKEKAHALNSDTLQ